METDDPSTGPDDAETPLAGPDGGTNLLVVGATPQPLHRRAYRRLCGGGAATRRLLVFSGRDPAGVDRVLPPGADRDPEHLRVVDHAVPTRSAAAVGGEAGALRTLNPMVVTEVAGDDIERLGATISETVAEFEAIAGGLDPGDLRLCFDSLVALVESRDRATVFGFLHLLTERLERSGAVSVFHLPAPRDHPTTTMFESLFDAVVEVRDRGGGQVRIHPGDGDPTDWLPIDDDTLALG